MKLDRFARRFLEVRPEQVDIKFLFDHLRNYGICAAIFYAGNHLAAHGAKISHSEIIGSGGALLFQGLAFLLFSLNFTHGLFALRALSERPLGTWIFCIFSVLSWFVLIELIGVKM